MKRVNITLECLCPDDMDPDVFGEKMLLRIENARGIESIDGQLVLAPSVGASMDQTVVDS